MAYIAAGITLLLVVIAIAQRVLFPASPSSVSPTQVIDALNQHGITCTETIVDTTGTLPEGEQFASCRTVTSISSDDRAGVSTFSSEKVCLDSYAQTVALFQQGSQAPVWVLKNDQWYIMFGLDRVSAERAQQSLGGELSNIGRP
ncbi:hypothetical protein ACFYY8_31755 [Streptosporangium sp. NPDC001559]|uniref:hypothetical protein n=1 Tax=Streptosporangium sp. NPDC001559 TaxID=3366187 RepID=UPI0036E847CA